MLNVEIELRHIKGGYILLQGSSVFSHIDVDVVCPKCGTKFTRKFDQVYVTGGTIDCESTDCNAVIEMIPLWQVKGFK